MKALEVHLPVSLEMLSHVELPDRSRFSADYDVTTVRADEVSLVIITGDFLTTQIGQVVFENLSERRCDMIQTELTFDGALIKLTKAVQFDYYFSDTSSRKNAS